MRAAPFGFTTGVHPDPDEVPFVCGGTLSGSVFSEHTIEGKADLVRLVLEALVATFRIAENTTLLVERNQQP